MASARSKKYEYVVGELLGRGTYGSVHVAHNKVFPPYKVALKFTFNFNRISSHLNEWRILKDLRDDNIIKIVDMEPLVQRRMYLEYCKFGSLDQIYMKTGKFVDWQLQFVAVDVLRGLEYLHQNRIAHRDIKGANILVDRKGYMKISDFGLAARLTDTQNYFDRLVGTKLWMAPEVKRNRWISTRYNEKCDIYSFGCTMIELSIADVPDYGMTINTFLQYIYLPLHYYSHLWSTDFHDFIKNALFHEYMLRASAGELIEHRFLAVANYSVEELRRKFLREILQSTDLDEPSSPDRHEVVGLPLGYSRYDKLRRQMKLIYKKHENGYGLQSISEDQEI